MPLFPASYSPVTMASTPRTTAAIRQAYLDFFASKGHAIIASAPVIPQNDPTSLFTTAGMQPLVPFLMGEPHPAGRRLADTQKCIRTNDIEEVGDKTHATFFEMLGNWSLGDYFKKESIAFSWELLTQAFQLSPDRLAVSVFAGDTDAPRDDESAAIWRSVGVAQERIAYLPKEDNWWGPVGDTGPCGPDTEIFYWTGAEPAPASFQETAGDKRWVEIWNNVFMQYNKQADGSYVPLAQQCVDTGMGLSRISAVLQGVDNMYDTDAYATTMAWLKDTAGTNWKLESARIIADHVRATMICIADGARPGNTDQGYVVRRLLRRAIRHAHLLGLPAGWLQQVAAATLADLAGQWPEMEAPEVLAVMQAEEEKFAKTLVSGERELEKLLARLPEGTGVLPGKDAFTTYETYGYPLEMIEEIAAERGLKVDRDGWKAAYEAHQAASRAGSEQKFAGGLADHSVETRRLHTACHLMHAALHKVLGDHVAQRGANITAERLRFDFSHPAKMTPEEIAAVEAYVNAAIDANQPITIDEMASDEAFSHGALGEFGHKYETMQKVKVYRMGDFSYEICGGPHADRTGELGRFKIVKEESSSAGVRRIKAVLEAK